MMIHNIANTTRKIYVYIYRKLKLLILICKLIEKINNFKFTFHFAEHHDRKFNFPSGYIHTFTFLMIFPYITLEAKSMYKFCIHSWHSSTTGSNTTVEQNRYSN